MPEVEDELHRLGRRGYARLADVADPGQVEDFLDGAQEVGRFGVRVNCVAPGFVQTEVVNELSPALKAAAMEHIALGRLGEDEEIAKVVSFLLSDDASYITGQVLTVDGGLQ